VTAAAVQVHVVASLPCYSADNVEKQRGRGVFVRSIEVRGRLALEGVSELCCVRLSLRLLLALEGVRAVLRPAVIEVAAGT
jgi:hypothetical protein